MRLLSDTHSFLWFVEGSPRLSARARRLIEDRTNDVFLSIASLWEMSIKVGLGKLTLQQPFDVFIPQQLAANKITLLQITIAHTIAVANLPQYHRDPFDRMLIAQAQVEQMAVVSIDAALDAYGVTRLW